MSLVAFIIIILWVLLNLRINCFSTDLRLTFIAKDVERLMESLFSSVGRALDWRSKGPWFDPGNRQIFYILIQIYLHSSLFVSYWFRRSRWKALTSGGRDDNENHVFNHNEDKKWQSDFIILFFRFSPSVRVGCTQRVKIVS